MTNDREQEIYSMVREQIANAIEDDIDGGEGLMKEVWERLDSREEIRAAEREMKRIIRFLTS